LRRLASILAALCLAGLLAGSLAWAEVEQHGDLRIHFEADFAPHSLPRTRLVPVKIEVKSSIATTDGKRPPPLRRFTIAINRHGELSTVGLPACTPALLQSTSSSVALERCRPALVGRGSYSADVELSSQGSGVPVKGTILAFNGRQGNRQVLLLHLYGNVPVVATFILVIKISHPPSGPFGTILEARVPRLAAGLGSITSLELKVGRRYAYRGQQRSFLSASCAAPVGFPGAIFPFARGSFYFAGHETFRPTLTRNCQVRP
jgi:hypothetical protein